MLKTLGAVAMLFGVMILLIVGGVRLALWLWPSLRDR